MLHACLVLSVPALVMVAPFAERREACAQRTTTTRALAMSPGTSDSTALGSVTTVTLATATALYSCSNQSCRRTNFTEGREWGIFSDAGPDCGSCQAACTADPHCGAVECGDPAQDYCLWWALGLCATNHSDMFAYSTCRSVSVPPEEVPVSITTGSPTEAPATPAPSLPQTTSVPTAWPTERTGEAAPSSSPSPLSTSTPSTSEPTSQPTSQPTPGPTRRPSTPGPTQGPITPGPTSGPTASPAAAGGKTDSGDDGDGGNLATKSNLLYGCAAGVCIVVGIIIIYGCRSTSRWEVAEDMRRDRLNRQDRVASDRFTVFSAPFQPGPAHHTHARRHTDPRRQTVFLDEFAFGQPIQAYGDLDIVLGPLLMPLLMPFQVLPPPPLGQPSGHAGRVLIGGCNLMVCPICVIRHGPGDDEYEQLPLTNDEPGYEMANLGAGRGEPHYQHYEYDSALPPGGAPGIELKQNFRLQPLPSSAVGGAEALYAQPNPPDSPLYAQPDPPDSPLYAEPDYVGSGAEHRALAATGHGVVRRLTNRNPPRTPSRSPGRGPSPTSSSGSSAGSPGSPQHGFYAAGRRRTLSGSSSSTTPSAPASPAAAGNSGFYAAGQGRQDVAPDDEYSSDEMENVDVEFE